jgi:hypothetical protein
MGEVRAMADKSMAANRKKFMADLQQQLLEM